ncbi:MAG: hypothetical protein HZC28_05560 [Spirochaetes bacterium]|nr:hypothetical protein [Spirochaetota bacterium]
MRRKDARLLCFFVSFAIIISCAGDSNVLSPEYQPQITNIADNFQLQASGLKNVTQTLKYTWPNSGQIATVNHSSAITGGSGTITIKDAAGTQVYSAPLVASGTVVTSPSGSAGNWTITITLTGISGNLNLRVQKS